MQPETETRSQLFAAPPIRAQRPVKMQSSYSDCKEHTCRRHFKPSSPHPTVRSRTQTSYGCDDQLTCRHRDYFCWPTNHLRRPAVKNWRIERHSKRWKPSTDDNSLGSILLSIVIIFISLLSVRPHLVSSEFTMSGSTQPYYMNSGQFTISQLCAGKSQFPVTKRIEGAVLSSNADADINCTITFRTKSTQQHFVIRFEELKLGCDDHLKMFDSDLDYGQPSIKDFSCRDSLASVPTIKTTGTFLTMRFSSDSKTKPGDGFRLVATAVFDVPMWDCPPEYSLCRNQLCISKSLFCDDINHCIDNSDESSCSSRIGIGGGSGSAGSGLFSGELTLSNALGLLVVLVLIIFSCVIVFILAIYCRRESHYAQYQHHLHRTMGVPIQTSSSLMFAAANHQPQYHYFQPANMSPYVTPQHHAQLTSTLPRGYSTLPLNLARQQQQALQLQQQPQHQQAASIVTKTSNGPEYLMMTGLAGSPALTTTTLQAAPAMQTNLFLPTSQSVLSPAGIRYPQPPDRR